MAKTSRPSKARAEKSSKRKRPARARRMPPGIHDLPDDEAYIDGCDVEFSEGDLTPDSELPVATGGVELVRSPHRRRAPQRKTRRST